MKKLFVSVPMKDLTEEEIKYSLTKMHRIAEAYEGEELELIDSWVGEAPPTNCNASAWYLGKSIEKLAEADVFIGIDTNIVKAPGCAVERQVALNYGIKCYIVPTNVSLFN